MSISVLEGLFGREKSTITIMNSTSRCSSRCPSRCAIHYGYHSVGNFYLINSKNLQIGIGIGKFSIINSEELHIGNFLGTEP